MKHIKFLFFLLHGLFMMVGTLSGQNNLGIFDNHTDIGNCMKKGSATYNPDNQTYTIRGSGNNMWFDRDEFHYLWTKLQGDFILRAEVKLIGEGVDPHRKAGWIVKNNLDNNSQHVNATIHGDGLTSLQYRRTVGGETEEVLSSDSLPDIIQLERRGNTYIMSTAAFGEEFKTIQLDSMQLDKEVYAGIYVCAHNPDVIETAIFRNVRICKPEDSDYQAYVDYFYSSGHSIQAPNYTKDGKKFIFIVK